MAKKRISFDIHYLSCVEPFLHALMSKIIRYIHYRNREAFPKSETIKLNELVWGRPGVDVGVRADIDFIKSKLDDMEKVNFITRHRHRRDEWKIEINWDRITAAYSHKLKALGTEKFKLTKTPLVEEDEEDEEDHDPTFSGYKYFMSEFYKEYARERVNYGIVERSILKKAYKKLGKKKFIKSVNAYISKFDRIGGERSSWGKKVKFPNPRQFNYIFVKNEFDWKSLGHSPVDRQSSFEDEKVFG